MRLNDEDNPYKRRVSGFKYHYRSSVLFSVRQIRRHINGWTELNCVVRTADDRHEKAQ